MRRGEQPRYDNRCRHMEPSEIEEKLKTNKPHVIRFKVSELTFLHFFATLVF